MKVSLKVLTLTTLCFIVISCTPRASGYLNPKYKNSGILRVALLPVSSTGEIQLRIGQTGIENTVLDQLTIELFKTEKFEIFERNQIASILSEQNFGTSGRTETEIRHELGRLSNLDALFLISISSYGGMAGTTDVSLNAKLVDIETGEIIYVGNAKSDHAVVLVGTVGESINAVVKSIANDIRKQF